jgi:hypothetical protein
MKAAPIKAATLAICALMAVPAMAKVYYVDQSIGSDWYSGLKESMPKRTIQAAIDVAAAGSTIIVNPGVYAPFRTAKKLTINASEGAESTIIDGDLGEKYVPSFVVPSYVKIKSYGLYYYVDGDGNPIYGDPIELGYEDYYEKEWVPPLDEKIWTFPYPKEKRVKT